MIRAGVESQVWLHGPLLILKAYFVLIVHIILDFNSRPRGGASGHLEISAPFTRRPHTEICLEWHKEREDEGREVMRFWSLILWNSTFCFNTMNGAQILHPYWFSKALCSSQEFSSRLFSQAYRGVPHVCPRVPTFHVLTAATLQSYTGFSIFFD